MGWGQDWGTAPYGDPGAPLLDYIEGFEHQTLSISQFGGSGVGVWDAFNNSAQITFPAGRLGGSAIRLAEDGVTSTTARRNLPATQHRVFSGYFKVPASPLPTVNSAIIVVFDAAAGLMANFAIETTGLARMQAGGGISSIGPLVADGSWHLLDFHLDSSGTTWTVQWEIDGVAQTDATIAGQVATNSERLTYGSGTATHNADVTWDDAVASAAVGDYPIGEHSVASLVPTSDGSYTQVGTNVMESAGGANPPGTDISAGNPAFGLMDEWPANGTDFVRQFAVGASNYVEVNFADTAEALVWGASAIVAGFASGTSANHGITRIVDASDTTLVDVYSGDMSQSTTHYRTAIVPVPSGGWTPTALNDLKARVGFSTNVTTQPRWTALMIQYVVGVEGVAQEVDLGFIVRTPTVFSIIRLTNPKATLGLISRVGVVFTPRLRITLITGLINRSGTVFAPAQFTQKVSSSGAFQAGVFQGG